jgi:hypothetical protein
MSNRFSPRVGIYPESAHEKTIGVFLEAQSAHATDLLLSVWRTVEGWQEKGITEFDLTMSFRADQTVRMVLTHPGQEFKKVTR